MQGQQQRQQKKLLLDNVQEQLKKARDVKIVQPTLMAVAISINKKNINENEE
jgi:hypothetical protein